ncbi:reverse transcriptase domain-containing protein [Tanacetum coccineum]
MFAATTPKNKSMAYRASTSANPNLVISPAFVEANYEALESLLRDWRRQMRNNDLRTELEIHRWGKAQWGSKELRVEGKAGLKGILKGEGLQKKNLGEMEVKALPNNIRGNLPSNGTFLSHHAQPFIPASLSIPNGFMPTHIYPCQQPTSFVNGQHLSFPKQTSTGNLPMGGIPTYLPQEGHAPQTFENSNMPSQNGSVTPFVCWIEDYPLPDGLKMPSHIGSYDGKGDPYNFLYLFEGAIRIQKWLMPVACHMFTYTLKDSARIWWNSQKEGSILDYEDLKAKFLTRSLVEHLSTDLPSTYKGLMEKTYTWVEGREVATNGASSDRRDSFKSLKEILATEKAVRSLKPPLKMFGSKRLQDMSKYCHFHEDYGHDTNDCRHLRTQIQEVVNSRQLSHLVKGIQKERTKSSDTPRGESKKNKGTAPAEVPILMVSQEAHIAKSLAQENTDYGGKEIIFPPVAKVNNAPVIIEAKIFERKVGRVYMDSGSSCEIIYEHCFKKLNPTIKATKVDLKTPLVGFSGERSWFIGEVLLEITIGDDPLLRIETLNFVIVRSDSSHNMMLGRTAMQRMGIVVSIIHRAIKFHTKKGIRIVLSADETDEGKKRAGNILAINEERVLSCVNAEEKIIVNNKYPNQTTHADMTGIPRTIMVEGKPFNMEHKLNECSHVKTIKQNKKGLGPDHNMVACKETKELTKAGILRKVKHQTYVANPVMVKKSDGGWRMYVDFTDINKACPKDCYPLPQID